LNSYGGRTGNKRTGEKRINIKQAYLGGCRQRYFAKAHEKTTEYFMLFNGIFDRIDRELLVGPLRADHKKTLNGNKK